MAKDRHRREHEMVTPEVETHEVEVPAAEEPVLPEEAPPVIPVTPPPASPPVRERTAAERYAGPWSVRDGNVVQEVVGGANALRAAKHRMEMGSRSVTIVCVAPAERG